MKAFLVKSNSLCRSVSSFGVAFMVVVVMFQSMIKCKNAAVQHRRMTWSKDKPQCVPLLYETSSGNAQCPTRELSLKRLIEWSYHNGIYGLNNFEFIMSDDGLNVGTKLKRDLKNNQIFLSAPDATLITSTLAKTLIPFNLSDSLKNATVLSNDAILTVFVGELLSFSEYRRGDAFAKSSWSPSLDYSALSYWRPFVDSIGPGTTYLDDFTDEDMTYTDDLTFIKDEMKTINEWSELYSTLCHQHPSSHDHPPTSSTRSFCDRVDDRIFAQSRRIISSRAFLYRVGDYEDSAMIPVFDLVNHSPRNYQNLDYDRIPSLNAFVMTSLGDLNASDNVELSISYGRHSNEQLIKQYGFALRFNTDDHLSFSVPMNERLSVEHTQSRQSKEICEVYLKKGGKRKACLYLLRVILSGEHSTKCKSSAFDAVFSLENEEVVVTSLLMTLRKFQSNRVWSRSKINEQLKHGNNSINVQNTMFAYAGEMSIVWLYSELLELAKDHLIPIAKKRHMRQGIDSSQKQCPIVVENWDKVLDDKIESLNDNMMSEWESPAIDLFTPFIRSYATDIASAPLLSSDHPCSDTSISIK